MIQLLLTLSLIYSYKDNHLLKPKLDTTEFNVLVVDTFGTEGRPAVWRRLLEVREVHSTAEFEVDPGACIGCQWQIFYKHVAWLTKSKDPLPKEFIVFKLPEND